MLEQALLDPNPKRRSYRLRWADLLRRVFATDLRKCPFCLAGPLMVIATITSPQVIEKFLTHLKIATPSWTLLPARPHEQIDLFTSDNIEENFTDSDVFADLDPTARPPPDHDWSGEQVDTSWNVD